MKNYHIYGWNSIDLQKYTAEEIYQLLLEQTKNNPRVILCSSPSNNKIVGIGFHEDYPNSFTTTDINHIQENNIVMNLAKTLDLPQPKTLYYMEL